MNLYKIKYCLNVLQVILLPLMRIAIPPLYFHVLEKWNASNHRIVKTIGVIATSGQSEIYMDVGVVSISNIVERFMNAKLN